MGETALRDEKCDLCGMLVPGVMECVICRCALACAPSCTVISLAQSWPRIPRCLADPLSRTVQQYVDGTGVNYSKVIGIFVQVELVFLYCYGSRCEKLVSVISKGEGRKKKKKRRKIIFLFNVISFKNIF